MNPFSVIPGQVKGRYEIRNNFTGQIVHKRMVIKTFGTEKRAQRYIDKMVRKMNFEISRLSHKELNENA